MGDDIVLGGIFCKGGEVGNGDKGGEGLNSGIFGRGVRV